MKKRIALITDIHGNLEALESVLEDIKKQNVDRIICLGDTVGIGPNSKECVDLLIDNHIDMVLGRHELFLLKGSDIDKSIVGEEKEHNKWVQNQLTNKEIDFIKGCPMYYEYTIDYGGKIEPLKYLFCYYLIEDIHKDYPFELAHLKKNINLWIKYNEERKEYFVGHVHESFDVNEVDGIQGDFIEQIGSLTNINIVDSVGCTHDALTHYMIVDIDKTISIKKIDVKYNRTKFINKVLNIDFPNKKNILKMFYGIGEK